MDLYVKKLETLFNLKHVQAPENIMQSPQHLSDSPPSDDASFKLLVLSIRVSWVLFPLSMHRQVRGSLLRLRLARLR